MNKKLLLSLFLGVLACGLFAGCQSKYEKVRKMEGRLESVSLPYKNFHCIEVVAFVWDSPLSPFRFGLDAACHRWEVYPVEKVPPDWLGKFIGKDISLSYVVLKAKYGGSDLPIVVVKSINGLNR